jgi:hypothetical protein
MTFLLLVTLVSMLLAIVMSVVAWRAAREERRRADARIATLVSDIQEAASASAGAAAQPVARRAVAGGVRAESAPIRSIKPAPAISADLFSTAAETSTASSRSVVVVGVGVFAFATAAALAVVLSNSSRDAVNPSPAQRAASPAAANAGTASAVPLELVALGQERDGDKLIVRGVVRNPIGAAREDRLVAVVFAFDRDGGFLTSGRATIDTAALVPGGESSFTVTVPGASNVARYRVSFRTETAVVPHVDKRHGQ